MSRSLEPDSNSARAAAVSSSTSSMTGRWASFSTFPVSTDSPVPTSSAGVIFRRRGLVVFLGTSESISVIQLFPPSRTLAQTNTSSAPANTAMPSPIPTRATCPSSGAMNDDNPTGTKGHRSIPEQISSVSGSLPVDPADESPRDLIGRPQPVRKTRSEGHEPICAFPVDHEAPKAATMPSNAGARFRPPKTFAMTSLHRAATKMSPSASQGLRAVLG